MRLSYLEAHNLRAIIDAELEPAQALNLLVGLNGSGKTSLLEGIHFLATGRGFRGSQSRDLIRRGAHGMNVLGRQEDSQGLVTQIGVERSTRERRISINGVLQNSAAELARHLPVVTASPNDHHELFQSAKLRRAMLDWLVFHVEPSFFSAWGKYQLALRQRNAELRNKSYQPAALAPWEQQLSEAGNAITDSRERVLERWNASLKNADGLLIDGQLVLRLTPGWDRTKELGEILMANRSSDRHIGYTQLGPHRADIRVSLDGLDVRTEASHGQRKLTMFALRLAQLDVLQAQCGRSAIVLVDDLSAELDPSRRRALVRGLHALTAQVFVTSTEVGQANLDVWDDCKLFHVERGTIQAA